MFNYDQQHAAPITVQHSFGKKTKQTSLHTEKKALRSRFVQSLGVMCDV